MEFSVEEESFRGRNLKVVLRGLLGTAELWVDGAKLKLEKKFMAGKSRSSCTIKDNTGNDVLVQLIKPTFDPVPQVIIKDKTIILAPPLKWYEYAWMAGPMIIMLFMGGVLPVVFAFTGFFINAGIFRSKKLNVFFRYFFTLLSSVVVWVALLITVGLITYLIKGA